MTNRDLTTAAGAPVVDNFNIVTAGRRGPALLQDVWLIEKLDTSIERLSLSDACTPREQGRTAARRRPEWSEQSAFREPPLPIKGPAMHWEHREVEDDYEQPGILFRMMTDAQKQALFENTARNMAQVSVHIIERHIAYCTKADPAYGAGIAHAFGMLANNGTPSL